MNGTNRDNLIPIGLAPMAVGTDTAGSIRIPSAWHSLVGFKPSSKKISTDGVLPLSSSFDSVGTICKSVKDTKILYNILSNSKNKSLLEFDQDQNIKIGHVDKLNFSFLDDLCKKKIEELYSKISKLGISVSKIKLTLSAVVPPRFKAYAPSTIDNNHNTL